MDEALQNVTDYIDTEGAVLTRRDYVDMLHAIKAYAQLCIEASEEEAEDEDDESDDLQF